MGATNTCQRVADDDDVLPSFHSDEGEEFAPTKIGPMSRAHVEAMMRNADADFDAKESGLRPLRNLPAPTAHDEEATAILPAERLGEVVAELERAAGRVNEPSSTPQNVAPASTPVVAPIAESSSPLGHWGSFPTAADSERSLPASYSPFLGPSRRTKDRQLAKEIAYGAAAFLIVLVPALYFLFR